MAKGYRFWATRAKKDNLEKAEAEGRVADSLEVRMAIMDEVNNGNMTLKEAQAEITKKRFVKAPNFSSGEVQCNKT